MANASDLGLQLSVHQNLDRGVQSLGIRAGMTHINEMPVHNEAHVPFGGESNSGLCRFNGDWLSRSSPPTTPSESSASEACAP
ncbi:UNVERIFIED_ORG: acyl-CoA reductase-like NAD-dependent aldehyde dehydrogenase [Arthrobacter globiformis]|nr:acyl-CoA reductase-like NAD-dependent aldehyde dehydrogenase [Arthrobacter globiformis]